MDNNATQAANSIVNRVGDAVATKVSDGVYTVTVGERSVTVEDHPCAGYWLTADNNGPALDTVGDAVAWLTADDVDVEDHPACPACGQFIDYCAGHGDMGDPYGASVLDDHDNGAHHGCHPAGCDVARNYADGVASLTGMF